jgi:thiamine biosynthesis lipoprotein
MRSFVLSPVLFFGLASSVRAEPHLVTRDGLAMGTQVRIAILTEDEQGATRAAIAALAEIERLEALMTTWRHDSEISRINAAAGVTAVKVSAETFEVLQMAKRAAEWSDGAFDVSYYALRGLWKFDEDLERKIPTEAELRNRLPLIDYREVFLDEREHTVFLRRRGMAINLGGIAKGYAIDRAATVLRRAGFQNAIVQAGGDLLCVGSREGQPWKVGVRDPRGGRTDVFASLKLVDHAFSTAGDYERFFILKGKRYHHILDPKTGHPASQSRSVTVFAKTALLADALDDAIFILGWRRGFQMIDKMEDVGAVVVDGRGAVHVSRRMKQALEILYTPKNEP